MISLIKKLWRAGWLDLHSSILTVLLVLSVGLNVLLAVKVREVTEVSRLLRLKFGFPGSCARIEGTAVFCLSA